MSLYDRLESWYLFLILVVDISFFRLFYILGRYTVTTCMSPFPISIHWLCSSGVERELDFKTSPADSDKAVVGTSQE
jgi:hypothetical protein